MIQKMQRLFVQEGMFVLKCGASPVLWTLHTFTLTSQIAIFHLYTEELLNYPLDCCTQAIIIMPILTALYTMLSDSVQVCILHCMAEQDVVCTVQYSDPSFDMNVL